MTRWTHGVTHTGSDATNTFSYIQTSMICGYGTSGSAMNVGWRFFKENTLFSPNLQLQWLILLPHWICFPGSGENSRELQQQLLFQSLWSSGSLRVKFKHFFNFFPGAVSRVSPYPQSCQSTIVGQYLEISICKRYHKKTKRKVNLHDMSSWRFCDEAFQQYICPFSCQNICMFCQ